LDDIADTHVARKLLVFDTRGDLVHPADYEARLRGANVIMRFTVEKFRAVMRGHGDSIPKEVFLAHIGSIRVLTEPPRLTVSPKTGKLFRSDPFTSPLVYKRQRKE
jgi:hypothetical protein